MGQILDDIGRLSQIDGSKMFEALDDFPDQLVDCDKYESEDVDISKSRFSNLIFLGMGGSASSGDVVQEWIREKIKTPSLVLRESVLPSFVDRNSIVIAISYSGNTSETLSGTLAAIRRKARLIGIGTGGRLESLLLKHDFPFVKIPSTVAPRAGLPQLVAALANVLQQLGVNNQLVPETIDTGRELQRLQGRYGVETLTYRNPAKLLARKLENVDLVVTYALDRMGAVARRFKNQLAENSKVLSKYAVLPEAGHNEVEAWRKVHKNILPLVLRDSVENRSETNFMQAFESTIKYGSRIVPIRIRVPAKSSLARLLAPIFFLDYVSVYLAVLRGVDPTPNPMINQYKKLLGR